MKELSFPIVNLNGTSREELQKQCRQAWEALQNACEMVQEMSPHGRDYQTVDFHRYALARQQHLDRLRSLEQVKSEIYEIWESLQS